MSTSQPLRVELLFPPAGLFPNRKDGKHWGSVSDVKQRAWDAAYILTKNALRGRTAELCSISGKLPLTLTFHAPDGRHRDLDNCLAAMKSSLDAVAKVLAINDKQFEPITLKRGEKWPPTGIVVVEVGA